MKTFKQIDCFNTNIKLWIATGIWPGNLNPKLYKYYSKIVVGLLLIIYNFLFTINFYFVEKKLDDVIHEMIFYFTEIACTVKAFTFLLMQYDLLALLAKLESDIFQPVTDVGQKIVDNAKKLNVLYRKMVAGVSISCNILHVFIPVIVHFATGAKLELPVCSYSFLSDNIKETYNYILYVYQSFGIYLVMWLNISIDTFILGAMNLAIAQLDILDGKLRKIAEESEIASKESEHNTVNRNEHKYVLKFNEHIIHYSEIAKYCELLQKIFSVTLFIQFSMASYIICVCLIRFILPAPLSYYIFLGCYLICMVLQVIVPCWFGTQIMVKSVSLANAIYDCDWTPRSKQFKTNMLFFAMRTSRPLCISGWKMFPLSLNTFTSIMNSAYSVYALLRHMQTRQ